MRKYEPSQRLKPNAKSAVTTSQNGGCGRLVVPTSLKPGFLDALNASLLGGNITEESYLKVMETR